MTFNENSASAQEEQNYIAACRAARESTGEIEDLIDRLEDASIDLECEVYRAIKAFSEEATEAAAYDLVLEVEHGVFCARRAFDRLLNSIAAETVD